MTTLDDLRLPEGEQCQRCADLHGINSYRQRKLCVCPLGKAAQLLRAGQKGPLTLLDRIAGPLADTLDAAEHRARFMEGRDAKDTPPGLLAIAQMVVDAQ